MCSTDQTSYDVAQAAYLGNPGTELASAFRIGVTDDVLFVAFSDGENVSGSKSALCMYTLAQIQQRFTDNIRQCFIGNGMAGLNFVRPPWPCQKSVSHAVRGYFNCFPRVSVRISDDALW